MMMNVKDSQRAIEIIDIGIAGYREAYNLQRELVQRRRFKEVCDTLILAEHPPVFTMGRTGSKKNLLVSEDCLKREGIDFVETDRGGDISFHGPGQLVLYPILDLREWKRDIHLYIRCLEKVLIDFLFCYNITGLLINGATGVWIDKDTKIASIGIGVSKWITYHGLSININTPLYYFDMINPCGLATCKMTSLSQVLKRYIRPDEAKKYLIDSFKNLFEKDIYEEISVLDKEEASSIRYS